MKKLLTATIASLALFAFAPIEADAGGKKKNKRAKVHKHHSHHHNHHKHVHRGHNHSRGSVRFSFGQPAYRSYYRPAPKVYRPIPRVNTNSRSFYSYRPYGFSGLSPFFGGSGHYCR